MANLVSQDVNLTSGWYVSSQGGIMVPNVEASDGSPTATAIVFFGVDNHHTWFDLSNDLVAGNTYKVTVKLRIGHNGFTGPFEIAYYTDGDSVNKGELTLADTTDWQTVEWSFNAGTDSLNDPSLRLIGWGQGAAMEYIVIDDVTLEDTTGTTDSGTSDGTTDGSTSDGSTSDSGTGSVVTDPYNHTYSAIQDFSEAPLEQREGLLVANPEPTTLEDFVTVVERDFNSIMEWGEENTTIMSAADTPFGERYFHTLMEAGTSSGSDVEGGSGWEGPFLPEGTRHAALRYRVKFMPGYDWVKGGKLPGLYGGDSPSGGASTDNGFTTRMMWRADGQGELYAYMMNKQHSSGDSIGRGSFYFTPGEWHEIEQEVYLNTVESDGTVRDDGWVRIWFDGQPIFQVNQMVFRDDLNVTIDGIMYTIFFGGASSEWRTPVDQWVKTGDYRIWTP